MQVEDIKRVREIPEMQELGLRGRRLYVRLLTISVRFSRADTASQHADVHKELVQIRKDFSELVGDHALFCEAFERAEANDNSHD